MEIVSNFEWLWLAKPSCDIYIAGGAGGVSGHVTYTYRAERAGAGGAREEWAGGRATIRPVDLACVHAKVS